MTSAAWDKLFKPARYGAIVDSSAGPWRVLEDAGELGPVDIVASELVHYLKQDAVLRKVFGTKFERLPWLASNDARELPRLAVYPAINTNSEQPTNTAVEVVSLIVATLWSLEAVKPIADGEAGVGTVLAQIKRVLRRAGNRTIRVFYPDSSGDVEVAVDHALGQESFGALTLLDGRPWGVVHEVESRYTLHVDRSTGRPINLPAA